jgi:hypothetical protein
MSTNNNACFLNVWFLLMLFRKVSSDCCYQDYFVREVFLDYRSNKNATNLRFSLILQTFQELLLNYRSKKLHKKCLDVSLFCFHCNTTNVKNSTNFQTFILYISFSV